MHEPVDKLVEIVFPVYEHIAERVKPKDSREEEQWHTRILIHLQLSFLEDGQRMCLELSGMSPVVLPSLRVLGAEV